MAVSSPKPSTLNAFEVLTLALSMLAGGLTAMLLLVLILQNTLLAGTAGLTPAWQVAVFRQMQAMGLPLQGDTPAYWYMSRASALIAYFFTWGSTQWGLLVSTRVVKNQISPAFTLGMHKFLSFMAIGFAAFHALILLGDHYLKFTLGDILIPFSAPFKPALIGVGTISLYLYTIILISFYIRKWIGAKVWRALHYFAFLTYLLVTAHALLSGTDSGALPVQAMYLASAAGVLFLVYYRILSVGNQQAGYHKNGQTQS